MICEIINRSWRHQSIHLNDTNAIWKIIMTRLTRFLIARPLLTNIALILILLFAFAAFLNIKRQAYPMVDFGKLNITTVYPGASPEDVELNVTIKLEDAIREVSDVDHYSSRSTENVSFIQVVIDPDTSDIEQVKNDIRTAIDRVSDLPSEVEERPIINEIKMERQPVYEIALTMDELDEKLVIYHIKELKKRLLDLPSVSNIEEVGLRDREIQILLDRDKLARLQVSFDDVIQAIKYNKIRVSGGSLESFTSQTGIVTLSEFKSPEDVARIIVRSNLTGKNIRILDIGRVVDSYTKKNTIIKYKGEPGISLYVIKKAKADVISSVGQIKDAIDDYRKNDAPKNINFQSTWDSSLETKSMLGIMYWNAALGLLFVVLILFLFLDFRIALWTAAGIPLSIAIAIIFVPILGLSINSISLVGLIVVLGMIVDDAIIIAESIYRCHEQGLSARESAVQGLQNVIKPVIGTIITTIIAFTPLYFIPGIVGDFSREIPSMVIVALLASLIEAVTILPAHLGQESGFRKSKTGWKPPGQKWIGKLEVYYVALLNKALQYKWYTTGIFLLFLIVGGGLGKLITNVDMFPPDQAYRIWIQGVVARGSNLDHTEAATKILEKAIGSLDKNVVYSYRTFAGNEYDPGTDSVIQIASSFMTELILTQATTRDISAHQVKDQLVANMKELDPEQKIYLDFTIMTGGPPVGQPLEIQIMGRDNKKRIEILEILKQEMRNLEITDIDSDYRPGKDEIRLLPDYERIAQTQLNVATIASTIRTAYDGSIVTYLQTSDERIPFRVILDEKFRKTQNPLKGLYVSNPQGNQIPLKKLVHYEHSTSPIAFYRYNSYRSNKLTGEIDSKKISIDHVTKKLQLKIKKLEKKYKGFKIKMGGEAKESQDFQKHMLVAIGIAILSMYLLLVVQFNSFSQPMMVILAIPFGLVGILLAFGIQRMDISMLSLIGILGFTGVVVNDSLIMVEFINRLRHANNSSNSSKNENKYVKSKQRGSKALSRDQFRSAVVEGARHRLRPIVLTTVTTVGGLIPTAYGIIGGFHHFVSPMVMAMTWGLLVGTTSVLIIIPVFYEINDDIMRFFGKFTKKRN